MSERDHTTKGLPKLCNDPRLSDDHRRMFAEVWQLMPQPERKQELLALADLKQFFGSDHNCLVRQENSSLGIFATGSVGPLTFAGAPRIFFPYSNRLTYLISVATENMLEGVSLPIPGASLHVSATSGDNHPWADMISFVMPGDLGLGPIHQISELEHVGLSFTGFYSNEYNYWIECHVLAVHAADATIHLLTEIVSATWNRPLQSSFPDVQDAGDQMIPSIDEWAAAEATKLLVDLPPCSRFLLLDYCGCQLSIEANKLLPWVRHHSSRCFSDKTPAQKALSIWLRSAEVSDSTPTIFPPQLLIAVEQYEPDLLRRGVGSVLCPECRTFYAGVTLSISVNCQEEGDLLRLGEIWKCPNGHSLVEKSSVHSRPLI